MDLDLELFQLEYQDYLATIEEPRRINKIISLLGWSLEKKRLQQELRKEELLHNECKIKSLQKMISQPVDKVFSELDSATPLSFFASNNVPDASESDNDSDTKAFPNLCYNCVSSENSNTPLLINEDVPIGCFYEKMIENELFQSEDQDCLATIEKPLRNKKKSIFERSFSRSLHQKVQREELLHNDCIIESLQKITSVPADKAISENVNDRCATPLEENELGCATSVPFYDLYHENMIENEVEKLKEEINRLRTTFINDSMKMKNQLIAAEKERDSVKLKNIKLEEQCQDLLDALKVKNSDIKKSRFLALDKFNCDEKVSAKNSNSAEDINNKKKCESSRNKIFLNKMEVAMYTAFKILWWIPILLLFQFAKILRDKWFSCLRKTRFHL